ncbi:hypothetical protein KDN32_03785 [Nocardioides sp. J2M5]|uniref:hypothetical protein n=1 Tax=Nocardioides palaemonis TaxID=2829810 RepID=UPI001BA4AD53|nr:hypothetical protein [Nocardioides palaemonis]MBS2936863.1 hypothetical protein [Nocardioides palaemonis]
MTDEYWSLDVPGLTREQAMRFQEAMLPDSPLGVLLLDPARVMVRGFDRPTVELMAKCLEAGLATLDLSHLDRAGAMSMLEDCRAWLEQPKT